MGGKSGLKICFSYGDIINTPILAVQFCGALEEFSSERKDTTGLRK